MYRRRSGEEACKYERVKHKKEYKEGYLLNMEEFGLGKIEQKVYSSL